MTNPHQPRTMMGFVTPGDSRVSITVRDWNALKLALWRSRTGWEAAVRAALEIVERCRHLDGCPGKEIETEPCIQDYYEQNPEDANGPLVLVSSGCPDREQRMSALVILGAARMFAPVDARRSLNDPYMAPSREYYSDVLASFAATVAELDAMREEHPEKMLPASNDKQALPIRKTEKVPEHLLE